MIIKYLPIFRKHYKRRIFLRPSLKKRFAERVKLFTENKKHPILNNHKLSGDLKGYYAFSITGDIRVVYQYESKDVVLFYDVGKHNQVYR